jgi:hypothetical protein
MFRLGNVELPDTVNDPEITTSPNLEISTYDEVFEIEADVDMVAKEEVEEYEAVVAVLAFPLILALI